MQFGAQDNALVTDRQVWTKCPSHHSIGPRGHSSSLRPCCNAKAERNGASRRKMESLPFPPPMNRSPAATSHPHPRPSSVRPYCKHFVLPIDVYTGTLSLMTVKSPLLRIACARCLGGCAYALKNSKREYSTYSICEFDDSLAMATCAYYSPSPFRQPNSANRAEATRFFDV